MSSVRVQKIFQGLPEQLRRLGGYANVTAYGSTIVWEGRVDSTGAAGDQGHDACVLDIDSPTWAAGNRRAILIADPAAPGSGSDTLALHTQSHAAGMTLDGSVSFRLYLETPSAWTNAQALFDRLMLHALMGQLGAPVTLSYCAHSTEPTVQGVNGAGSTASFTSAGTMLPYGGISYPGGV